MPVVIEEFEIALQPPAVDAAAAGAAPGQAGPGAANASVAAAAPALLQEAVETLLARQAERALRLSDA
jgi:hypothetical protein